MDQSSSNSDNKYILPSDWQDPGRMQDLIDKVLSYTPDLNLPRLRYAYYFAEKAHKGQSRNSGEPFINHPLEVCHILADLHMDEDTIIAGLLHDTAEDTSVTLEIIEDVFGGIVAQMVDGVTKLKFKPSDAEKEQIRIKIENDRSAESLRKMLLAMAKDIRVMIIKLADRLHNMRTLDSMPPRKQTRIASETINIYAPLAGRLGIWQIKWQLEDLSFKFLHPHEFKNISEKVAKTRKQREQEMKEIVSIVKERLESRNLFDAKIYGRPKHLYSIFNKIVHGGFHFEDILDLIAIRIVVPDTPTCYLVLGLIHEIWQPVAGLFYDYIAKPKPNGYQSLHTKVVGPHGEPLEIQIRSKEMHRIAEYGVAAHWTYKENVSSTNNDVSKMAQLRQYLFEWSGENRNSSDFLRSVSTDLFAEQLYVFTPKGDVIALPQGSTPIDFAFRVHTDVGLTTVGAKINGNIAPLSTQLQNGDIVEMIVRSNAQPSLDWMEFVQTSNAKGRIRAFFRKKNKQQYYNLGKETLEKELIAAKLKPAEYMKPDLLDAVAKELRQGESSSDLIELIGEGIVSANKVITKLRNTAEDADKHPNEDVIQTSKSKEGKTQLTTKGLSQILLKRAKCCDPIPGEDVVGYTARVKGIVIHRKVCKNALEFLEKEPERVIALNWPESNEYFGITLKIITYNRQGLLVDISSVFSETSSNVSRAKIRTLPNLTAEIIIGIDVKGIEQLKAVVQKINNMSDVIEVSRTIYTNPNPEKNSKKKNKNPKKK